MKFGNLAILRYGLAVVSVVLALVVRFLLDPYLVTHYGLSPFYAAIMVTTWAAGFGPSLVSIILGYLAIDWFVVGPHAFDMAAQDPSGTLIYFCLSLVISSFGKSMHDAERQAREKKMQLEEEVAERRRIAEKLIETQKQLQRHAAELEQRVNARTAQLQETVNSLEGVCYGIAHDLRAPIRSMNSFASALEQEHPGARELTGKIKAAAQRMDQLVQDLLRYGRLGHGELVLASVSLEPEVDCVLNELKSEILSKHAVVTVDRPLPNVLANEAFLRQILANLLGNALKFVRLGVIPRIQISARDGPMVRLCIQDNGIGIDPRFHAQIFRIFERLHSKEAYPGTGIGLAIVKKGVERMGGQAGVESELGKGSLFWIELPAAKKA